MKVPSIINQLVARIFRPSNPDEPQLHVREEVVTVPQSVRGIDSLVNVGNIYNARLQALAPVGQRLKTAMFLCLIGYLCAVGYGASSGEAPADKQEFASRKIPDVMQIREKALPIRLQMNEDLPTLGDMNEFVRTVTDGLNHDGKIAVPCQPTNSLMHPWVEPLDAKDVVAFCKSVGKRDDAPSHVFMMTAVKTDYGASPWMGSWSKQDGKWRYATVAESSFAAASTLPTIPIEALSNTILADFKDTPTIESRMARPVGVDGKHTHLKSNDRLFMVLLFAGNIALVVALVTLFFKLRGRKGEAE